MQNDCYAPPADDSPIDSLADPFRRRLLSLAAGASRTAGLSADFGGISVSTADAPDYLVEQLDARGDADQIQQAGMHFFPFQDNGRLGNNRMLLAEPNGRALFVNIQHPGETASERSNPATPTAVSAWPASPFPEAVAGRPVFA